ncbi:hypothetical protein I4F81_007105 [Pyropia yezoensis]|uniref:Uncharacterized protein n=1 Tax=Pyropia yezoensis TaxID=2788 RepID=A0ACC3C2J3_PYRYE|nr:hypothetical protein I4F81_007105 [Neopyropia yezoensis]
MHFFMLTLFLQFSDDGEGGASQTPAAPGTAAAALAAVVTVYRLRKSVDTRKEKSLGVLSQRFVQLFLLGGTEMPPGDVGTTSSAAAGAPGSGPSGGGGVGDSSVGDTAGIVAPGAPGNRSSTGLADGGSGGVANGADGPGGSIVSLEAAAARLLGPSVGATPAAVAAKMKTKVRRLYDIANILASLNIIKKVHTASRKPAFRWLGPATPQAPATAGRSTAGAALTVPGANGNGRGASSTVGEAAAAASASAAAAAVIAGARRSHAHLSPPGPERSRKRLRVSPHVPVSGGSPAVVGAAGAPFSPRDSYVSGSADGDDGSVGSATPHPAAPNASVASTAPVSTPVDGTLTAGGSAAAGPSAVMAQYTAMLAIADVAALQAAVSTTVPDWLSPTSVERYMSAARAAGPEFEQRAAEWHASVSTWKGAWQKWQGCVAITASGAGEAVPSVGSRR